MRRYGNEDMCRRGRATETTVFAHVSKYVFRILDEDEERQPSTDADSNRPFPLAASALAVRIGRQAFLVFVPSPSPLPSATYPGIRQEREGSCSSTSTYGRRTVLQAKPPCLSYSSVGPGSPTLASVRLGLGSESESESESESSPSDDSALMAEQVRIACMTTGSQVTLAVACIRVLDYLATMGSLRLPRSRERYSESVRQIHVHHRSPHRTHPSLVPPPVFGLAVPPIQTRPSLTMVFVANTRTIPIGNRLHRLWSYPLR
ncbi:hypothetical protein C8F01DRAFT_1380631 [Mycena amicta]|nr:hypothetical protein C8F01DRAFT_1380631 [Mycena amicta]